MPETASMSRTIDRRRFLKTTVASTTLIGGVVSSSAQRSETEYSLIQDGKCIPIQPLHYEGLPVEDFYGYRTPQTKPSSDLYASFGTENLQRKNTSILFLYKGPKGVSLVIVHDKINSGGGAGAATFRMTKLPVNGNWAVKDDNYNSSMNYDTFSHSNYKNGNGKKVASSIVNWTWQADRSDGGVFSGLNEDFGLNIYPSFNKSAALWKKEPTNYEKIQTWEVLSADQPIPARTQLKMDKPVTIQSKPCSEKQQTTSNSTNQNEYPNASKQQKSHSTQKPSNVNNDGGKSLFDKIGQFFSSLLNGVMSFFTGLF